MNSYSFSGEPIRLDAYLASIVPDTSRNQIQHDIREGRVRVNDAIITKPSFDLETDCVITHSPDQSNPLLPDESVPFDVLYKDEAVIVISKPANVVVHPTRAGEMGTLVHGLLARFPEIIDVVYDDENPISKLRPGIVHRLDRDTEGVMVVARTKQALLALKEQFHDRLVDKTYETLLYGNLKEAETVTAPIHSRGAGSKNVMRASHEPGQGRNAVSHFTPLELQEPRGKEFVTRTRVELETGRTHQIRVHARFIGHPVMGDDLYGNKSSKLLSERMHIKHQLLAAIELSFTHPTTGERLTFNHKPTF